MRRTSGPDHRGLRGHPTTVRSPAATAWTLPARGRCPTRSWTRPRAGPDRPDPGDRPHLRTGTAVRRRTEEPPTAGGTSRPPPAVLQPQRQRLPAATNGGRTAPDASAGDLGETLRDLPGHAGTGTARRRQPHATADAPGAHTRGWPRGGRAAELRGFPVGRAVAAVLVEGPGGLDGGPGAAHAARQRHRGDARQRHLRDRGRSPTRSRAWPVGLAGAPRTHDRVRPQVGGGLGEGASDVTKQTETVGSCIERGVVSVTGRSFSGWASGSTADSGGTPTCRHPHARRPRRGPDPTATCSLPRQPQVVIVLLGGWRRRRRAGGGGRRGRGVGGCVAAGPVLNVGSVAAWDGEEQLAEQAEEFAAGERDEVRFVGVFGCRLCGGDRQVGAGGQGRAAPAVPGGPADDPALVPMVAFIPWNSSSIFRLRHTTPTSRATLTGCGDRQR